MAVSKTLRKLLRVRGLEEEQQRATLESALAELHRIDAALEACRARERRGRSLMRAAPEMEDRLTGRVELDAAQRHARILSLRRNEAEREAARLREQFLAKRIERRQAETLVQEAQVQDERALSHRAQQSLDEWHAAKTPAAAKASRQAGAQDEEFVSEIPRAIPHAGKGSHF